LEIAPGLFVDPERLRLGEDTGFEVLGAQPPAVVELSSAIPDGQAANGALRVELRARFAHGLFLRERGRGIPEELS